MNPKYIVAEDATIDTDEGRFVIRVTDANSATDLVIDIHNCALEFEAEVRSHLRPYALEAEHARQAVAAGVTLDEYVGREPSDEPWPFDPDLVRDIGRNK